MNTDREDADAVTGESARDRRPARGARRGRESFASEREAVERGSDEREMDEREITDDEAVDLFRDSQLTSVLPSIPHMPEYHVFWATTNNPRDSIQYRMRLGYELIKVDDLPGWEGASATVAGITGVVGINEMVAMRIRKERYNKFMRYAHHQLPLEEEMKLRSRTDDLKEQAAKMGARLEEGDGTAEIVSRAKPPPDFDDA